LSPAQGPKAGAGPHRERSWGFSVTGNGSEGWVDESDNETLNPPRAAAWAGRTVRKHSYCGSRGRDEGRGGFRRDDRVEHGDVEHAAHPEPRGHPHLHVALVAPGGPQMLRRMK